MTLSRKRRERPRGRIYVSGHESQLIRRDNASLMKFSPEAPAHKAGELEEAVVLAHQRTAAVALFFFYGEFTAN